MKSIVASLLRRRVLVCLALAGMCAGSLQAKTLAVSSFTAVETPDFSSPEHPTIHLEGKGLATGLGSYRVVFDLSLDPKTLLVTGKFQLDMGSGDKLVGTVGGGASNISNPAQLACVNPLTVTGGSGKFQHAAGVLTVRRILEKESGASTGSIEGELTLPGA